MKLKSLFYKHDILMNVVFGATEIHECTIYICKMYNFSVFLYFLVVFFLFISHIISSLGGIIVKRKVPQSFV